jgi:hypothetical protein
MKTVAIFRPGKHVSAAGDALEFTEKHLADTIAAYDPSVHEAPIVVGHPKDNGPAYGWVRSLAFAEGELVADVDQVDPAFAEMVQAGRFKKRSASFYSPSSPSNPKPGVFYLRHVGFLGAQPPAVKGLKEVAFADADEGVVEFADDAVVLSLMARMVRGLRDTLLAKWGQEETEKALPGYLVEDLEAEARRARETPPESTAVPAPAFHEPKHEESTVTLTPEQIAELQAKAAEADALKAQVAEFAEREAKAKHAARVSEHKAELGALVTAGKVLPRHVDSLAEFMAKLDDSTEVAEFGEADKPRTALSTLRAFLGDLPKAVEFGERGAGSPNDDTPSDSKDIAAKARAYRDEQVAKGNHISFTEAVNAIAKQA